MQVDVVRMNQSYMRYLETQRSVTPPHARERGMIREIMFQQSGSKDCLMRPRDNLPEALGGNLPEDPMPGLPHTRGGEPCTHLV